MERAHRTLEDVLQHFLSLVQDDRDELLQAAEFAIGTSWHELVRNTPFTLNTRDTS